MNSSTLCHGVTLKGKPCTKRTLDSNHFCHHHREKATLDCQEPKVKLSTKSVEKDECCVCYEQMPVSDALGCKHLVCKGCLEKMRDDRCPMCRTPIKKLSGKAKAEIQRRRTQDTLERYQVVPPIHHQVGPINPYQSYPSYSLLMVSIEVPEIPLEFNQ